MGLLVTAAAAFAVIAGFTLQNITIVYWLQSPVSAYAVLMLCGLAFALFFPLVSLAFALRTGDFSVFRVSDDPWESRLLVSPFRPSGFRLSHAQTLAAAGFCNALNGILIVYASAASKTPPLIQAILQNCGVLFSVPFSKLVLGDTKRYCAGEPLRAAGVVVLSVVVSLAPTVAALASGAAAEPGLNGWSTLAWVGVYTLGLAPSALLNILQQLYFIRTGALRPEASPHEQMRGALRALSFSNLMQPLTYAALFWVDLLPWFGYSGTPALFGDVTRFSLACSLGGPALAGPAGAPGSGGGACAPATPAWAGAFVLAYILAYFGGAQLNRESATFNMLCLVVVTASTALVWLIPGVNPNGSSTPLWSVLSSLGLALAGSALWKRWEGRTPPEEQFPALFGAGGEGELFLLGRSLAGAARGGTFDGASSMGGWSARESHVDYKDYGEREEDEEMRAPQRGSADEALLAGSANAGSGSGKWAW